MKHILRYLLVAFAAMLATNVSAQEVTIDVTSNDGWGFPTAYVKTAESYTNAGVTLSFGESNGGHKFIGGDNYLIFGKQGATLSFSAFNFDVERIDIIGRTGASGSVKQNIYVGDEAVSTETTGATGTNQYKIAEGKQTAGTIYTLKVNSSHNTQITKILIWKKGTTGDEPGGEETPYELVGDGTLAKPFTTSDAIYLANKGEYASEKVYIAGKVFKVSSKDESIVQYGNIDYFISEDGKTASPSFEIYRGKYFNDASFTIENKVKVGDNVVVYGTLKMYNTQAETAAGAVLVKLNGVVASGDELVKTKTLDFTNWSAATITNLKADAAASKTAGWSDVEKKADAEADAEPTAVAKDNCFWFAGNANEDGTLSANGVVIEQLKGLKFSNDAYNAARSLAIAVNYPVADVTKDFGPYAGPSYLWLGGKGKKCFTIPDVPAGATIFIEAESHKISEGRGVQLKQGDTQIGDNFTPKTLANNAWTIETAGDVDVWNTNGCHIYTIKVVTKSKPEGPATIDPSIDDDDPAIVANKAALLTAINKGKNADLTNKTSASKKALADAIAEGEAQLASKNTTIAKIDAARRAILQAIDELENRPAPIAAIAVPEGWRSVITNGTLEGDDMSCFFSKTSGGAPEPSVAVDYEGVDDWKAIVINSTASTASQDWDDQFFIKATEKLAVGTKYRVEFDYRSDIEGAADTQTHNQPSEYIHWACINSVTFKPEWQHHKFEGTVSNDQTGNFQTVAFNMSKNRKDTKFVIDNIVFLVEDTTTGIKSVENNTGDVQYFDLQGRRVAQPAKGLYIKNGKMVMVK